ncbi:HAD family hydrolase [Aquifex aeolicus]|uniref:Phosphoglycolate phosphatase n=1 Tax=Aquifex aeolicus (strain VF5) TaxID=224324 RepID=GPH_AQUAE|nr:HAD family hydrolase [Aquifex aeolicus]O67359.1 RecName: Full=Phosphoglycolate phosphatase; Short=PGP; Short=PGPase [Aquifex aeolicus VF5]AAC07313.1 phosphoglycolate phosphatase [Aquifex aeolicus VF5]
MRVILFDLDGTLIDSAKDIALALEKTLKELGLEEYYPDNVTKYIGGGVRALLEKVLKDKFREEYVEVFRKHYLENPVVYTKPYPEIPYTLEALKSKGFKLAVVSNKLEELSKKILDILNLSGYFDLIVGGDTFGEKKPSPTPVLKTLEILGEEPEKALIVGDTDADIEAGKRAGTKTALALWGYVKLNSQIPDFTLSRPSDLVKLMDNHIVEF